MVFLVPLEILAVEFLIPWPVVRIILLVLSVYGTVWILGFIAALSVRPHTVGDGKVVLRFAHFTQIAIPLELVESVRTVRHSGYRRAVQIADGVLAMPIGDSTTLSVTLREPYPVAPKPASRRRTCEKSASPRTTRAKPSVFSQRAPPPVEAPSHRVLLGGRAIGCSP
ncbi:hypothetical protein ACLB9X_15170 [Streptomyces sp. 5K101]|uniref:hypothetical protein n=1 Tax=Streptomyces sp. 5K101 TaxID=3390037 RepID=UPI003975614D